MNLQTDLIKGADVSSLLEVEAAGGRFFDEIPDKAFPLMERCPSAHTGPDEASPDKAFPLRGRWPAGPDEVAPQDSDLLEILKRRGVNLIRLRLWNDPYDSDGNPYGAGTNDLARTMELARRCKALGLPWLLDFHYSDFWADPGKQYPPKAWENLDAAGLTQAVYDFTRSVMTTLKNADLLPALVAPGNELSNGLLWPLGKTPNWENIARFVSAGIRAVRDDAGAKAADVCKLSAGLFLKVGQIEIRTEQGLDSGKPHENAVPVAASDIGEGTYEGGGGQSGFRTGGRGL